MKRNGLVLLLLTVLLLAAPCVAAQTGSGNPMADKLAEGEMVEKAGMGAKLPLGADGIVRLSKIEVDPQFLAEYRKYATEVGEISLRTEPGVLAMYAMSEKERPWRITILEIYASQDAYKKHIASAHFQKYKQGTLHMVKDLILADQVPLNKASQLVNFLATDAERP